MKKLLPLLAATATVFVLFACSAPDRREPVPSLEATWRLDSVSLLDTADGEAALAVFLHAYSKKDSPFTYFEFRQDSVFINDGSTAERYRYTRDSSRLLVEDSTRQLLTINTLNDSMLLLNSGNKIQLHLRRLDSGK